MQMVPYVKCQLCWQTVDWPGEKAGRPKIELDKSGHHTNMSWHLKSCPGLEVVACSLADQLDGLKVIPKDYV